jgi:hypothetical protein
MTPAMALFMLDGLAAAGGEGDVYTLRTQWVNRLNPEEEIRSRLRELTEETRRVREELQAMIRRDSGRTDAISIQRDKLRRQKRHI